MLNSTPQDVQKPFLNKINCIFATQTKEIIVILFLFSIIFHIFPFTKLEQMQSVAEIAIFSL